MKQSDAWKNVGGLSSPGKMPGFGWSISAERCVTGGALRNLDNSVCSNCYACKGRYMFKNVKAAHERRYQKWHENRELFIESMVTLLNEGKAGNCKHFRWFDSGDLQGQEMLHDIIEIAKQTPDIRHWVPTKEYGIIFKNEEQIPENMALRVSAPFVNSLLPYRVLPNLHEVANGLSSAVYEKGLLDLDEVNVCLATVNHTTCDDEECRKCWDRGVETVIYMKH